MAFSSADYLFFFFPLCLILTFIIPQQWRWIFLLFSSLIFYSVSGWQALLIVIFLTLFTLLISRTFPHIKENRFGKWILAISVLVNLGMIFFFRTVNVDSSDSLFSLIGLQLTDTALNMVAPIGISFFVLQNIGFLVDTFRDTNKTQSSLLQFLLFSFFFPRVTAGPIERGNKLIPQFLQPVKTDPENIANGLRRMTWGLFKKVVVADRLAVLVQVVFDNPTEYMGGSIVLAVYFFAFQIYCDFSGYTDMALGAAEIFGIKLSENFRQPYFAKTVTEFWNRWHISLSTWLRDYLFYPIRRFILLKPIYAQTVLALIIPTILTMLISGIWHGVGWTFIIWGIYLGCIMVVEVATRTWREKVFNPNSSRAKFLGRIIQILITFHLVAGGWIFFRANSLTDAITLIRRLFIKNLSLSDLSDSYKGFYLYLSMAMIMIVFLVDLIREKNPEEDWLNKRPTWLRWVLYFLLVMAIFTLGIFNSAGSSFIYFRF